eukprot:Nitzschia sp. Nitz4//NODE_822_length_4200_cov_77.037153//1276//1865//NITZ4_additional_000104-RA//-1//CDS//3329532049//8075//frame0
MKIALISHDGKKVEMVAFALQNQAHLLGHELYATGTTGKHLQNAGFDVTALLSGPKGGDAQIAAMAATGQMDMVIFFRDAFDKHPHEPDVQMLLRICDAHNIPLATNPASATLFVTNLATPSSSSVVCQNLSSLEKLKLSSAKGTDSPTASTADFSEKFETEFSCHQE